MKKIKVKFDDNTCMRYEIGKDEEGNIILREYVVIRGDYSLHNIKNNISFYCIEYAESGVKFYAQGNFHAITDAIPFFEILNKRIGCDILKMPKLNDRLEIEFVEENISPKFSIDNNLVALFLHYTFSVKNFNFLNMLDSQSDKNLKYVSFNYSNMPSEFITSFKKFTDFLIHKTSEIERICGSDSSYEEKKEKGKEKVQESKDEQNIFLRENETSSKKTEYNFFHPVGTIRGHDLSKFLTLSQEQNDGACLIL